MPRRRTTNRGGRGGRRPGAGAPKGNFNALKTGRYSRRVQAMRQAVRAIASASPELNRIARSDRRQLRLLSDTLRYCADLLLTYPRGATIEEKLRLVTPRAMNFAKKRRMQSDNQTPLDASGASPVE